MIWKVAVVAVLVGLIVVAAVVAANAFTAESDWDRMASGHKFNILRWESQNLLGKWTHLIREAFRDEERSADDKASLVRKYLVLEEQIESLRTALDRAGGQTAPPAEDATADRERLAALTLERDGLESQVEEIVEGQISAVLADEGLSRTLWLGSEAQFLFPPVDFEFESRPNVLIVSHRDRVEIIDTSLLVPDMSLEQKIELEADVDERGPSALVEQVGGVATYPSIVPHTSSLMNLLSKTAHEWMHHYLFFRPLGMNYWSSYEMTTINETVANIAGDEIAVLTYDRFYEADDGQASAASHSSNSSLDFAKTMRETRVTVDGLLAEGRIEEAERFMDERRQFLEDNGYYLRKLNQAYFAFHGSYADTPTSVNPIGDQLRDIRERSESVGDFIRDVAGLSSYDALLESLSDGGS